MAGSARERIPRFRIIDALNAEWDRLVEEHRGILDEWGRRQPALADCADLAAVLPAIRSDPDPLLAALLAESAAGDLIAARTVLQTMLGKLVRMALRDPLAGVDDYVVALWCRIRSYPLARRPRRIAANLALDTLKDVSTARAADRSQAVTPWPPEEHLERLLLGPRPPVQAAADVEASQVLAAAVQLRLLHPSAGAILHSVYVEGLSSRAAADRHQMSADMVRYRCSRAIRQLQRHAEALADAA